MSARAFAVTAADIDAAAARLADQIAHTPCLVSATLSAIHGCTIVCKFENLQYTASFKDRGAANCLMQLDEAQRARGVIAASAGNHAQAVAYHAARLGALATIVMPRHTPFVKVAGTERLGAEVVLEGDDVDQSMTHALTRAAADGLTFVHPFDNAHVIAGQGTLALEMLDAEPDLDTLLVPIGGGGLIAGIAIAAKARRPELRIIGVEAERYAAVKCWRDGLPAPAGGPSVAEGIAVKEPGRLTLPVIEALVDDVVVVDEADLEAAILQLLEIEKTVVEGAGAAGLAAIAKTPERFRGGRVGIVLCGGNIDPRLLSAVILRGLVTSSRLVRLVIAVPDLPGSLAAIAGAFAELGANIVDVRHRREFSGLSVKSTEIEVTAETRDAAHAERLQTALAHKGVVARAITAGRP